MIQFKTCKNKFKIQNPLHFFFWNFTSWSDNEVMRQHN